MKKLRVHSIPPRTFISVFMKVSTYLNLIPQHGSLFFKMTVKFTRFCSNFRSLLVQHFNPLHCLKIEYILWKKAPQTFQDTQLCSLSLQSHVTTKKLSVLLSLKRFHLDQVRRLYFKPGEYTQLVCLLWNGSPLCGMLVHLVLKPHFSVMLLQSL